MAVWKWYPSLVIIRPPQRTVGLRSSEKDKDNKHYNLFFNIHKSYKWYAKRFLWMCEIIKHPFYLSYNSSHFEDFTMSETNRCCEPYDYSLSFFFFFLPHISHEIKLCYTMTDSLYTTLFSSKTGTRFGFIDRFYSKLGQMDRAATRQRFFLFILLQQYATFMEKEQNYD